MGRQLEQPKNHQHLCKAGDKRMAGQGCILDQSSPSCLACCTRSRRAHLPGERSAGLRGLVRPLEEEGVPSSGARALAGGDAPSTSAKLLPKDPATSTSRRRLGRLGAPSLAASSSKAGPLLRRRPEASGRYPVPVPPPAGPGPPRPPPLGVRRRRPPAKARRMRVASWPARARVARQPCGRWAERERKVSMEAPGVLHSLKLASLLAMHQLGSSSAAAERRHRP